MAKFQQMKFTQMQERLRMETLRLINRGTLSISLLARKTGYGQPHLSSFVHNQKRLSLEAMDRVMAALELCASDLVGSGRESSKSRTTEAEIPLVSYATALNEPHVRSAAIHAMMQMPEEVIKSAVARPTPGRKAWERFVIIRVEHDEALPMKPLIQANGFVLLDRHHNSFMTGDNAVNHRPNIYAVRQEGRLALRYLDFCSNRLVLRPHNRNWPVELIELDPSRPRHNLVAGRVTLIMNVF